MALSNDTISVEGLSKTFDAESGGQSVVALDSINLEVRQGSFVTLFGPSGCGKTTLLRILAGLEDFDEGAVSLFGQDPAESTAAKNIAWTPQSSALMPWRNIEQNCEIPNLVNRAADRKRLTSRTPQSTQSILSMVGLGKFMKSRPAQLSGGMQQRASLSRSFVHGAPLMLMDEPFSALDEITRISLRYELLEIWSRFQKTIVFVTHSAFESVLMSDEVVIMTPRPGRIKKVIPVDLPRPRHPDMERSPELHAIVDEVKDLLRSKDART